MHIDDIQQQSYGLAGHLILDVVAFCEELLQKKNGPKEEFIVDEEAVIKKNQIPKRNVLSCPICQTNTSVILYGRQKYAIKGGQIPSTIYRCKKCDFNFRRFGCSLSEVFSHFKVAPYSNEDIENRLRMKRKEFYLFLLSTLSKPADGKALLDIGCAFGHFLDYAVECGYRPFGVEVSEEMAELLRKRKNYPVSSRPLCDLQLSEKQFDVVTFVDSFYYFDDPVETLHQCCELLKPGGELLMRVTNRNGMARLYRVASALTFKGGKDVELPFWTTDDAISCHSRRSLIKLMSKTGFRIVTLTCFEKNKRIDSLGIRLFYHLTSTLARLTCERICLTPGIICLATKE